MVLLYNLLRGRIGPGVYHLFGQAATGKTTIAMACAAAVAATGKACAWINTANGFSPKRFATISRTSHGPDHSSRVLLNKASTPLAEDHAIEQLTSGIARWSAGLIVLDTAFGAIDRAVQDPAIRRVMWVQAQDQLSRLAVLARLHGIPLVVVNTVGYKPGQDQERPTAEKLIRALLPEEMFVRPIVGKDGKTGRFTYLSCDDETEYEIVDAGIKQRAVHVLPRVVLDDTDMEVTE